MSLCPAIHQTADVRTLSLEVLEMSASAGSEFAEKFPFAIVHLQASLHGFAALEGAHMSIGDLVMLGLAGIRGLDSTRIPYVFALQSKWMAIRLAGHSLVAFCPTRDFQYLPETSNDSLSVSAFGANGKLLGSIERRRSALLR